MSCNCKTYCKESLYAALRNLRKQCLYYNDDDCKPDIKELDDVDASRIHDAMEKLSNGYALVPVEPTEQIKKAIQIAINCGCYPEGIYRDAIQAAQEEA